jgi:hypothetical protein
LKKARPLESYDSCFIEAQTTGGVDVKLAFTHATAHTEEAGLHCECERGRASLFWSGCVRIEADGEPARELMFDHDPKTAAMLDFLGLIEGSVPRAATRLQDTLSYLQMVNGAYQSSGGSSSFAPELIERAGAVYCVRGLDEQFAAFATDPARTPSLLTDEPMPWIETAAIREQPDF